MDCLTCPSGTWLPIGAKIGNCTSNCSSYCSTCSGPYAANCTACKSGDAVFANGTCPCPKICTGKSCGSNGCGGNCGTCNSTVPTCTPIGTCETKRYVGSGSCSGSSCTGGVTGYSCCNVDCGTSCYQFIRNIGGVPSGKICCGPGTCGCKTEYSTTYCGDGSCQSQWESITTCPGDCSNTGTPTDTPTVNPTVNPTNTPTPIPFPTDYTPFPFPPFNTNGSSVLIISLLVLLVNLLF